MKIILTAEGVRYRYEQGREVLRGIDLEVQRGEIFVIMGPNGVGKTTLLKLFNLFYRPTAGSINFNLSGSLQGVSDGTAGLRQRRRMVMVFQKPALFKASVWGNVAYGLLIRMPLHKRFHERFTRLSQGLRIMTKQSEVQERVKRVLETVELSGFERRDALTLSGGEAQRVALARALVVDPEILFLDEPTANLDPRNVAIIESVIRDINRAGTTVVLATHNIGQVKRLQGRAALLLGGRIVESGGITDIFSDPRNDKTRAFINGELVYSLEARRSPPCSWRTLPPPPEPPRFHQPGSGRRACSIRRREGRPDIFYHPHPV